MATAATHTTSSRADTNLAVHFHLSLNVANLERSVAFFQALFGCEPRKCRADYAKFELNEPPLVLSLEPGRVMAGGALNHLGFRLADAASLVDVQRRLEIAGISTRREEGVECCYARQTKFWAHDPDGNLWEVYTLDEDLEHRGDGHLPASAADEAKTPGADALWVHRLGDPFPQRLPILNGTVDRVQLQGTLNEHLDDAEQRRRLQEVLRVLKPGGSVQLHMLTSDRDSSAEPIQLPGPAARVQVIPQETAVLRLLEQIGFAEVATEFHAQHACFTSGTCEFRETRIRGTRKQ